MMSHVFKSKWVIVIGIWSVVAVFTSTQLYLKTLQSGGNTTWFKLFYIQLLVWNVWGAMSPLIYWLGRRFRIDRQNYIKGLLIHIPTAVLMVLVYLSFYSMIWNVLGEGTMTISGFVAYFKVFFVNLFHWHFFIYVSIVGVVHAFDYYKESKAHELDSIHLEKELALNQLNTLKIQLQPHFLFNTLNNVISSIRQGKDQAATNMLTGLGDLLRTTLVEAENQFSPLKKEITFVRSYLDIEGERFKELDVLYDVPSELEEAKVPNFILQPIVENAIKHGISRKTAANRIEITAARESDRLRITVYNEGPLLGTKTKSNGLGMGIGNTKRRLSTLYGDEASLQLLSTNDGVISELILPFEVNEKN